MIRAPRLSPARRRADGGSVSPPTHDLIAPLAAIWPETFADPAVVQRYGAVLAGLDPAAIATAASALGAKGRPAPPPDILRTVVLSWQQAAATTLTAAEPASPAIAFPAVGARVRALIGMLGAGLLLLGASGLTRDPWMTVANSRRAVAFAGGEVSGGGIVAAAGPLAMLLALVGAVLVWRSRPAAHARVVLALLAAVSLVAVYGAMTGVMRVSVIAARLDPDGLTAVGGIPGGLPDVVSVSTGPALWTSLLLALVSVAASAYGLIALRRA